MDLVGGVLNPFPTKIYNCEGAGAAPQAAVATFLGEVDEHALTSPRPQLVVAASAGTLERNFP